MTATQATQKHAVNAGGAAVEEILRFNRDRKRKRIRLKFQRMDENLFAFFRGTDHLFARAWPELKPPDPGPDVLVSGDLHLENFGAYQTDQGEFRFDINDFDEALIGPAALDLVRCTTSILLAADLWAFTPTQASGTALVFLQNYRSAIAEAVASGIVGEVAPGNGEGPIWDLLGATALGTQNWLLDHHTFVAKNGARRILRSSDKHPDIRIKRAAKIRKVVQRYGKKIDKPKAYKVLDVASRIAGVGSLGVRRYMVLIQGGGSPDQNRLLDIKEALPSSLLSCADYPQPDTGGNEARRVVDAQRHLQALPTAGLDVLKIGRRWFRIRELVPDENRSNLSRLHKNADKLRRAVEVIGKITAWSQIRGCRLPGEDHRTELARWAAGPAFDAVLAAAIGFSDRAKQEYEEFHQAYADGLFGREQRS